MIIDVMQIDVRQQWRGHRPCGVPSVSSVIRPSSSTPAFSHFWMRRMILWSPIRCSTKSYQPLWLNVSKKARISASSTMIFALKSLRQGVQRVVLAAPGAEPVGEPRQNPSRRSALAWPPPLFGRSCLPARRHRAAVVGLRFGYILAPRRQCSVCAPLDPSVQVRQLSAGPPHIRPMSRRPRPGPRSSSVGRRPSPVARRHVMQERGEHGPFVSHRCLTYAAQRLEHASRSVSGPCFAVPHSPWPPLLAPSPPHPVSRLCSATS